MSERVTDEMVRVATNQLERATGWRVSEVAVAQALALAELVAPERPAVEIDYTNHRGERDVRWIRPTGRLVPGSPIWHPTARWTIEAMDIRKGEMRTFDPAHIHRWGDAEPAVAPEHPAVAMLRNIEWANEGCCPQCVGWRRQGHEPDCALAKLINVEQKS